MLPVWAVFFQGVMHMATQMADVLHRVGVEDLQGTRNGDVLR